MHTMHTTIDARDSALHVDALAPCSSPCIGPLDFLVVVTFPPILACYVLRNVRIGTMASHKGHGKEDSPVLARTLVRCVAMQSAARVLSRLMSASSPKNSPGPMLPTTLFCPCTRQAHADNGAALPMLVCSTCRSILTAWTQHMRTMQHAQSQHSGTDHYPSVLLLCQEYTDISPQPASPRSMYPEVWGLSHSACAGFSDFQGFK